MTETNNRLTLITSVVRLSGEVFQITYDKMREYPDASSSLAREIFEQIMLEMLENALKEKANDPS